MLLCTKTLGIDRKFLRPGLIEYLAVLYDYHSLRTCYKSNIKAQLYELNTARGGDYNREYTEQQGYYPVSGQAVMF